MNSANLEGMAVPQLKEYIRTLEHLVDGRDRLLAAIPACKVHGEDCIPNALVWIEAQKRMGKLTDKLVGIWDRDK